MNRMLVSSGATIYWSMFSDSLSFVLKSEHVELKIWGGNFQILHCLVVYLHLHCSEICSPQIPQTPPPASQSAKFWQKCISSAKELTLFRYIQIYWISCCQCIKKADNLFTYQIVHHTHIMSTLKTYAKKENLQQKLNCQYLNTLEFDFFTKGHNDFFRTNRNIGFSRGGEHKSRIV